MAHSDLKITPQFTDRQFKQRLDECADTLSENLSRLIQFKYELDRNLEELEPSGYTARYAESVEREASELRAELNGTLECVTDICRQRSQQLTAREEARRETADEVARLRSQLAQILLRRGGDPKRKEETYFSRTPQNQHRL